MNSIVEDFNIEEAVGYIVFRTATEMRKSFIYHLKLAGIDLTPEELAILVTLWQEDDLSQSALIDKTLKDKTTVTRLLSRIKNKGFIEKKVNPTDRRNYTIHLTQRGKKIKDEVCPGCIKTQRHLPCRHK